MLPTTGYPTNGNRVTYGWVNTALVQGRDRNATLDPRLAGVNFVSNGSPATFYVDLPSPGTYSLSLALGDAGFQSCWVQCQIQFLDGSTVLATVAGGSINLANFYDATGKIWPAAQWPTNNLSQQVTLTGSRLTVVMGTSNASGDDTPIAFLGVTQLSGGSPNYTISASPASLSVQQGNQGTSTITTTISGGFNSAISLSASGVPSGTTVSFNPNPIPAPGSGSSTMTIKVGGSTATGTYPITVTGNGGGIQQNTTVTLTVTAAANFSISASPASLSVQQGNQGTSTITTTISGGFNSAISLSASGVPSGTTVSFNPNPIPSPGSGNSTMTIKVGGGTAPGTYPITVTGNGGGIQQSTTVTLTVTSGTELYHFSLTVIAQHSAGQPGNIHDHDDHQRWLQQRHQLVGFRSAVGDDGEFQPQPDTGARLRQLNDDSHGRRQHTGRNLPNNGDRQWQRHPAEHDGYLDSDCIVGMGYRIRFPRELKLRNRSSRRYVCPAYDCLSNEF